MLFTEFRFLPFFLAVFGVHWALRGNRLRKGWLLACSYAFYAGWDPRFLTLIVISTLVDYTAAKRIVRAGSRRRGWLLFSLTANLGLLGFFKYFDFFIDSAGVFLEWLGFHSDLPVLRLILPVGISFYTFQTLSYTIDVYRGRLQPVRSLLDLATFVAFFPQLVAGPIVRAADFLPMLGETRRFADVRLRPALMLFLVGFIKKACISDNLSPVVDEYFADPAAFDAVAAWNAVLYYAAQIYCDFSGYTDMAIACAALLGYRIPDNFRWPYLAANITQFWRRWHMSLSSWLRDYLYIPLGGNRGGRVSTHRNLMLTMLLGGLWHGAAWHFVWWGGLHGAALAFHKEWDQRVRPGSRVRGLVAPLAPVATFWFVCVCWILFRAESTASAATALRAFTVFQAPGTGNFGFAFVWIMAAMAAAHFLAWRKVGIDWWQRAPDWLFAAAYGLFWAVALAFVPVGAKPFIYFQF